MLVKHNLLNQPTSFKKPSAKTPFEMTIIKNTLILKGKTEWSRAFINEDNNGDIKENIEYIAGFIGSVNGQIQLYKSGRESYQQAIIGDGFVYTYRNIDSNSKDVFYFRTLTDDTEVRIKKFFVTDELADIILDKKSMQSLNKQAIYPPEGDYKEIQPH